MSHLCPDKALINGKIITMDKKETIASAISIIDGKILSVGSDEEIKEMIRETTEVIDLNGKTVVPGFIDSHCHMVSTGGNRKLYVDLSEEAGVRSISDIQDKLRDKARITPEGEWIYGYQEDDSKLEEGRHPTRWELDEASKDHPILVSTVGGHFSIANSKAFEMADVDKDTPDPVGGKFERDPETGQLTGGLHEKAIDLVRSDGPPEPSREQASSGAKEILRECAEEGLTCIYDTVSPLQIRAVLDLKNRDELPIRIRMDIHIDHYPELEKLGIYRGLGDDWVRICGLKFFFDGAISARTAAVSEPYLNRPDFYGVMATTREIARKTILDVYKEGYRISAHANGDRAIEMYLDIMEEAQALFPDDHRRNRDIHCTVVNDDLISRINKLDILPTIFGPYVYYHGDKLIPAFGDERLEMMFASKSFLDAEVKISAHSDHPCAPLPPLMGLHGLVNRKTKSGKPIGQSQKISVMEALKLYTVNAAYQSFDEDKLGSLEKGKYADLVILGEDILSVPTEEIIDIPIEATMIEGKFVYKNKESVEKN